MSSKPHQNKSVKCISPRNSLKKGTAEGKKPKKNISEDYQGHDHKVGSKPILLWLHGAGGTATLSFGISGIIDRLGSEYDIYALDLPGFGRSTIHWNGSTKVENISGEIFFYEFRVFILFYFMLFYVILFYFIHLIYSTLFHYILLCLTFFSLFLQAKIGVRSTQKLSMNM